MTDYSNTYSFAVSNAAVCFKSAMIHAELGNEQIAIQFYLDYRFWIEYAESWIKGKN
jgi:hypothetical protein